MFAMTVHKSRGSGVRPPALVLPDALGSADQGAGVRTGTSPAPATGQPGGKPAGVFEEAVRRKVRRSSGGLMLHLRPEGRKRPATCSG
ncbi:hypothetical protein ACPA9J_27980 [Pseudomonas aeruginosa]